MKMPMFSAHVCIRERYSMAGISIAAAKREHSQFSANAPHENHYGGVFPACGCEWWHWLIHWASCVAKKIECDRSEPEFPPGTGPTSPTGQTECPPTKMTKAGPVWICQNCHGSIADDTGQWSCYCGDPYPCGADVPVGS